MNHGPPQNAQMSPVRQATGQGMSGIMRWIVQRIVIVLDNSQSMEEFGKYLDTFKACCAFLEVLIADRYANSYRIAVVRFNSSAWVEHGFSMPGNLASSLQPGNPSGSTSLASGLDEAYKLLVSENSSESRGPENVVLLLSDGEDMTGDNENVLASANTLKEIAVVVTVPFGPDADRKTLQAIASSIQCCYDVGLEGGKLRGFLCRFGRTLGKTISHGGRNADTLDRMGHDFQ